MEEDLSEYKIKAPKQILAHLNTLISKKCLVTVSFGDGHSFLSVIIDIDEKNQLLTIDCGPKEYLNKELLSLGIIDLKSEVDGVKVLFKGHRIKKAGKMSQPALSIKIPESIYWVQRRRSYRARSPLSKSSYCSITFKNSDGENEETLDFQLFDLSATGFCILSETLELAEKLTPLSEFYDCKLVLDNMGSYDISFKVQSKFSVNPKNPLKTHRIGCLFLDLAPAAESSFLRYIQMVQREIKKTIG